VELSGHPTCGNYLALIPYITVFLEDEAGNRTEDFEMRAWFADASDPLIGFDGVLDRAVLHIDMMNLTGYLDIG